MIIYMKLANCKKVIVITTVLLECVSFLVFIFVSTEKHIMENTLMDKINQSINQYQFR